jgi:hypothetical protein
MCDRIEANFLKLRKLLASLKLFIKIGLKQWQIKRKINFNLLLRFDTEDETI